MIKHLLSLTFFFVSISVLSAQNVTITPVSTHEVIAAFPATQTPLKDESRKNLLKINPFSLAVGQLSLFYERSLTKHISLTAGYGMGGNRVNFGRRLAAGGAVYRRATLEIRRYWTVNRLTGFYAGTYVRLNRLTVSQFMHDQQGNTLKDSAGDRLTFHRQVYVWAPGVVAGIQWRIKRICFDGFLGVQRQLATGRSLGSNQLVEGMTAAWAIRMGGSVGFDF